MRIPLTVRHLLVVSTYLLKKSTTPAEMVALCRDARTQYRQQGISAVRRLLMRKAYREKSQASFTARYRHFISESALHTRPGKSTLPEPSILMIFLNGTGESITYSHPTKKHDAADAENLEIVFVNNDTSRKNAEALKNQIGRGRVWIAFIDAEDRFADKAFSEIAQCMASRPDAKIIYADEDEIGAEGDFENPNFKPDWSIDLFLGWDLFGRMVLYDLAIFHDLELLAERLAQGSRRDIAFRATRIVRDQEITHIPRILLHAGRSHGTDHPGSNMTVPDTESMKELLAARSIDAVVESGPKGLHIKYNIPSPLPKVSLIIATRDQLGFLKRCIETIWKRTDYPDYEIIIVDNGSVEPETLDWIADTSREEGISCIREESPFNFSLLNNLGVAKAHGDYVALINNDIEIVSPNWLREMMGVCAQPHVGVVGPRLHYPDGAIQHAGVVLNPDHVAGHWYNNYPADFRGPQGRLGTRQRVSAVTGACLLTPKALYLELDGLNAENLAVAYNDIDYCLRVNQAGYQVVYTPFAELIHHESKSRGRDLSPAKKARLLSELSYMKESWNKEIKTDRWAMPGLPSELGEKGWLE